MKNMNEALAKAKEIIKKAEMRKAGILQEIEETEAKNEKALQEAGKNLSEGNTRLYIKAKNESEAYKERIRFLESESEKGFTDMESEINELQAFIKEYVKEKNRGISDVYYNAWIEGTKAEKEAEKVRATANWIIQTTDKILNRYYSHTISQSVYSGMLEPSKKGIEYIEAWKGFKNRKRREAQMKE